MNTFFKGLMGAAALLGVATAPVHAQDYTWTFSLGFDANETYLDSLPGWDSGNPGTERPGAGASGTIVVTQNAPGVYSITSFTINSTTGVGAGTNPTDFAVLYSSDNFDFGTTDDDFAASMKFFGPGDMYLTLGWANNDFITAMQGGVPTSIEMYPGASSESQNADVPEDGFRRRFSGGCVPEDIQTCPQQQGQFNLTRIDVPEPVSMALFGTGLFGLVVARRRRAA